MAAIKGNTDISNMTSDKDLGNGWLNVGNSPTISMAFSIPAMVMSAIIVFGNLLVVLSVWKDPLKKLRSSPSNRIIVSMAIADLLVGLVVCPLMAYWVWAILHQKNLTSVLKSFFVLTDVSSGHVLLLTVDRVFASVTPLQYRIKVTKRRVCIASIACWAYFILFGCAFGLWEKRIHYSDQNIHCTKPLHSCKHLSFKLGHFLCLPKAPQDNSSTRPLDGKSPNNASEREETIQGHRSRDLCVSSMLRAVVYSAVFDVLLHSM